MQTATFNNFQYLYIGNNANAYDQTETRGLNDYHWRTWKQTTGWHYIPNQKIDDWLLPYQWYRLTTSGQAFRLKSVKCTVSNMIPVTEQVSIQGNASFSSFNNTIYALGYNDTLYDAPPNWPADDLYGLQYREGINPHTNVRIQLPLYQYTGFNRQQAETAVLRWDPFQHPELLMELRPGKNAIEFN